MASTSTGTDARSTGSSAAELSPDELRERRKRDVALGYRILAAQRWGDLGDGHISARDPEREDCFWMLRYGVSYHEARISDLVLIGPGGELVEGEGDVNQAGYYIHHPILAARPELVSACHVHTGWGTPFSAELRPIEPISQESCIFFEDHAIFDDEEVQIQSLDGGRRIAEAMGQNRAVILRNHGLLTAADRVDEAVGSFVHLERVAEVHMKARNAVPISAEAARFNQKDLVRFGPGRVAFRWLVARHVGDVSAVLG
jgi:ribulose-5-phosphate 4-epimerase/fuculose-1-phosphate aldolase